MSSKRHVLEALSEYLVKRFHFSQAPETFDKFDSEYGNSDWDNFGPHVGTEKAAKDRFEHLYENEELLPFDNFSGDDPGYGFTVPLLADDLLNNGSPSDEDGVRQTIQNIIGPFETDAEAVIKLKEQGYTNIPYINDVEDKGSTSSMALPNTLYNAITKKLMYSAAPTGPRC